MRIHQEMIERIRYVERFEVLISGNSTRLSRSPEYPFSRAANRQMPVSKWLQTRFKSTYPEFRASVIYPDGSTVRSDIPVGVVRDAYEPFNSSYGQSMKFKFSSDCESAILELKRTLEKAKVNTNFSRPSFLGIWRWFRLEGEISNIHLPVHCRRKLPNILNSLALPKKIGFESELGFVSHHLFQMEVDYSYFGMEQFEILKSIALF